MEQDVYRTLCVVLSVLVVAWAMVGLVALLRRRRKNFDVILPLAGALLLRLVAAAVLSGATSLAAVRDPDEAGYISQAFDLSGSAPWSHAWLVNLPGRPHVILLAIQTGVLGDPPDFALRVLQIGLSVAAICVLSAAAFDLSGPRGAKVTAWLLAVEPSHVFFSGLANKEPLMFLAEAVVVFGAVRMWQRRDVAAAGLIASGSLVATGMRPYAGVALLAGGGLVTLHASLRRMGPRQERAIRLATITMVIAVAGGALVVAATPRILKRLQTYQQANAFDRSNLRLEPVNFSTRRGFVSDAPRRVRDILIRPYPWQTANWSQRSGALGTVGAWVLLAALLILVTTNPRAALSRGPPLAYLLVIVIFAYAVATGNAGTGFRYRSHVVALGITLAAVLATAPRKRVRPPVKAA
jgi:hypothetical protein